MLFFSLAHLSILYWVCISSGCLLYRTAGTLCVSFSKIHNNDNNKCIISLKIFLLLYIRFLFSKHTWHQTWNLAFVVNLVNFWCHSNCCCCITKLSLTFAKPKVCIRSVVFPSEQPTQPS